jgi:cystathionine beta-lyase
MSTNNKNDGNKPSPETILTHAGRTPAEHFGFVNTPIFHGSTILFRNLDELENYKAPYRYGRFDNPTMRGVEALITELEGAAGTALAPSGLAAVSIALLAVLEAGDEVLMTDSCYEPTRNVGVGMLSRLGIKTTFYDPRIGAGIGNLIGEKTKAIFVESPGSLTFEIQDLPAIVTAARPRDIAVIVDNSWATPLYQQPLRMGADIVVHAGTKMFVGHSDAMFGTVSANARIWPLVQKIQRLTGVNASPDDSYLAGRGLKTLAIRMKELGQRALEMARWLEQQKGVRAVFHPALPSHPDHAIWKRDFTGSGSLFAFELEPAARPAVAAMVDGFELFGMGYSWGGYESLCIPTHPDRIRTATKWDRDGCMFRIHIGLEGIDDLKADMGAALERFRAAR